MSYNLKFLDIEVLNNPATFQILNVFYLRDREIFTIVTLKKLCRKKLTLFLQPTMVEASRQYNQV